MYYIRPYPNSVTVLSDAGLGSLETENPGRYHFLHLLLRSPLKIYKTEMTRSGLNCLRHVIIVVSYQYVNL